MSAGRIIAFIVAAILIFFGVLFIWGAFSPQGSTGWIPVGIITVGIGLVLVWIGIRAKPGSPAGVQNTTLKIDLPAKVAIDSLKCQSCGGALSSDNIKMVAGAPVVSCPYCKSSYQLTEEPKW
jgi:hypothetical protein